MLPKFNKSSSYIRGHRRSTLRYSYVPTPVKFYMEFLIVESVLSDFILLLKSEYSHNSFIFLRYVENGSLANIIKPNKFGAFPESLVAVYIAQVSDRIMLMKPRSSIQNHSVIYLS